MSASARLGVAWEAGRLVLAQVVKTEDGFVLRSAEVPESGAQLTPDAVIAALESAGFDARRATLVLGGDATVVKPVALPPVPPETQLAILRQDGERYFLLPPPPRCYGLWKGHHDGDTWVVAASEEEVRSLVGTLEEAGLVVEAVTLAAALYRDGVRFLMPDGTVVPSAVVRSRDGVHEIVTFRGGRLSGYRRVEGETDDWQKALAEAPAPDGPVALVTDDAEPAARAVSDRTVAVLGRPGVERPAHLLGALAAALADPTPDDLPDLMPPAVHEGRRRASTRRTARLAATATFLLVLLLGLLALRRDRQDARLAEEMAAVQAEAEPVIAMRTDLERISRELIAHRRIVDERTDWLALLQELSLALPEDAWLAALEAREDGEVVVTGYARSAGDVLTALAASPRLGEVRFENQAARTQVAGRPVESFSLAVEWIDAPE
jgi:Tfp pilus assembly protein PilN